MIAWLGEEVDASQLVVSAKVKALEHGTRHPYYKYQHGTSWDLNFFLFHIRLASFQSIIFLSPISVCSHHYETKILFNFSMVSLICKWPTTVCSVFSKLDRKHR